MLVKSNSMTCLLACLVFGTTSVMADSVVLVEAEAFKNKGGWVVDPQFMDQMGSPYLLAHGLGHPVADASTTVTFPETGEYKVWVRTFDWVAPWKTPETPETKRAYGTPGVFELLVDGKKLDATFGTTAKWAWQDGGTVKINRNEVSVTLHDLTGFEGRCDAVLFSKDATFTPPSSLDDLTAFRRRHHKVEQPEDAGEYDLVVVGGGISGICAALTGARNGLTVALIQDRPVLGGNNSSETRVWLLGTGRGRKYPRMGDILRLLEHQGREHGGWKNSGEIYEDEKRLKLVRSEKNLSLFLNHRGNGMEMDGRRIKAVIAEHTGTGERYRFGGRWFADCTGDGCIGFLAGADFDITLKQRMGRCNMWNVKETDKPVTFPRCPWALDLTDKPFPGRWGVGDQFHGKDRSGVSGAERSLGCWSWESGFDHDPFEKSEYIRDWNFRAAYGAWDALKNVDKIYPNHAMIWLGHISGKRESRRLLGPVVVTETHIMEGQTWPDDCLELRAHTDLHYPHKDYRKDFEGDAFISYAEIRRRGSGTFIPYRMLYSRNTDNLFMAGRCASVSHVALGASRLMRTCGLMGEVVGLAAALCKEKGCDPNDVYEEHLESFKQLLTRGPNPDPALIPVEDASAKVEVLPAGQSCRVAGADDTYYIDQLPDALAGLPSVVIPRGDLNWMAPGFKFQISGPADIYLAVHDRGGYKPPADWKETDLKLTWMKTQTDTVYVKSCKAGVVAVPGHDGRSGPYYGLPHIAFVKGTGVVIAPVTK